MEVSTSAPILLRDNGPLPGHFSDDALLAKPKGLVALRSRKSGLVEGRCHPKRWAWRWRESNSRPKQTPQGPLHA